MLVQRCQAMQNEYHSLVSSGRFKASLGPPEDYFQAYFRADLDRLRSESLPAQASGSVPSDEVDRPITNDDWARRFALFADLDAVKFPLVCVREPGVSCARCSAVLELKLAEMQDMGRLTVLTSTEVVCVKRDDASGGSERSPIWAVRVRTNVEDAKHVAEVEQTPEGPVTKLSFDYLVNAAGFETPTVDTWVQAAVTEGGSDAGSHPAAGPSLAEFKSSYVVRVLGEPSLAACALPEMAFLGPRGSNTGMVQISPYGAQKEMAGKRGHLECGGEGALGLASVAVVVVCPPSHIFRILSAVSMRFFLPQKWRGVQSTFSRSNIAPQETSNPAGLRSSDPLLTICEICTPPDPTPCPCHTPHMLWLNTLVSKAFPARNTFSALRQRRVSDPRHDPGRHAVRGRAPAVHHGAAPAHLPRASGAGHHRGCCGPSQLVARPAHAARPSSSRHYPLREVDFLFSATTSRFFVADCRWDVADRELHKRAQGSSPTNASFIPVFSEAYASRG